ncbi:hypothetical protein GCM10009548_30590 [Streptomyces malaysiensis subsp. malaysiensis]|uniref:DUF1298 domain-containing protein n=1 Tax=Streptomyces malaysiensis TaxID=92644 RepID=A0ABX6WFE4_STRMQ|nr:MULTISPECIES: WS/DGAT domain-containing protein [Streptomyces]QPI59828.1 DUF1298 domain-containing protein [Streptomyces solisilvae]UHH21502.1 WSD1 family O-acyltransferase [Streptomyces sp. HNM0561]
MTGKSTGDAAGEPAGQPTGKPLFPDAALVAYGRAHPGAGLTIGVVLELAGPPPERRQLADSLRPVAELLGTRPSDGGPWNGAVEYAEAGPGRELSDVAHEALTSPLEPHRWSCGAVAGLPGGTSALVWRADHRLLDGAGAAGALAAWTGAHRPDAAIASPARAEPWRARGAVHRAVTDPLRAAWLCGAPLLERRRANAAERAGDAVGAEHPPTALSYACAETGLGVLRDIARRHGTTVNDVYLAALSGALRTRPELHGPDRRVRALVPVNVRGPGDAAVLRNRHIPLRIPLPVAEPEAGRRLALVAARTAGRARALRHPLVRAVFRSIPTAAGGWCFQRYFDPAHATLLASNVRGPSSALAVAGRRVLRTLPLNFLPAGHRLSTVLATAQGRAVVGFTTSEPRAAAESLAAAWLGELRALASAQAAATGVTTSPTALAR